MKRVSLSLLDPTSYLEESRAGIVLAVKKLARILTSVPVLTFFILFGLDIFLRHCNVAEAMNCRSIDLWDLPARIEFCDKIKPQVATVGSSLLMVVNPVDLSAQLSTKDKTPIVCGNLCSGTQMVSDVFMIAESLVARDPEYPHVLIFGTCLRDFVNDMYALEWTGESFNSIAPYVPVDNEAMRHVFSVNAQRELWLCHYWYLYRNRLDFKNIMFAWTKDALENLPLDDSFERLGADMSWHAQKKGLLFEQWIPRKMGYFTAKIDQNDPKFLKNYYKEYQQKMWADNRGVAMEIEGHYFMELIKFCKERGITLVVVNMPISSDMEALAPNDGYKRFAESLKQGSAQNQFLLIDLASDKAFTDNMYMDGVHLNQTGAHIVAEKIGTAIKSQYPQVLETIARQQAEQNAASSHHQ